MLKHGLIADAALFARLADGVALRDEALILCNLRIKGALVSEDPRDAGARNLLNFGHTVGHAYEALGGFAGLTHGQAVAAGMVAEAWLGQALGLTPPGTDAQIAAAVRAYGLPERVEYPAGAVCDAALADKKRRGNTLLLPVLREVGRAELVPVPLADFRACLEEIL